jgi:Tfp pilus assembly protein PilZ
MDFEEKDLQYPAVTHRLFQLITEMSDDERRTLLKLLENGLLKGRCRRGSFRKPLRLSVSYTLGERTYFNYIKDISLEGVFIFTHNAFQTGQQIRIFFTNGDNTSPVKMMGKVARATPEGIGVEFLSSDIDKIEKIVSLASEE